MKRLLGRCWRWNWVLCLPFLALFVHWATATWRQWQVLGVVLDNTPYQITLLDTGKLQAQHLWRQLQLALTGAHPQPATPDARLRTIELFVTDSGLAQLAARPPYSGLEFQDGQLVVGKQLLPVKVRYRGDTVAHWGFFKKSFRIKTGKDDQFEGMHACNLIAAKFPEQLNNYLGYRLAERLGLLAPRVELVDLCLNGKYHGLYELTEQLDDGTLRRHDRMPGDLYAGELLMLDMWRGCSNRVFELPQLWQKVAANDRFDPADHQAIAGLCAALASNQDEAGHAALAQWLDLEAFARFGVFALLTQTHHFDDTHNWRLHWDSWRGKFEPIVWDAVGWQLGMRPKDDGPIDHDCVYSLLDEWLHADAGYLRARFRLLEQFFQHGGDRELLQDVDTAIRVAKASLAGDVNMLPQDFDVVARAMADLRRFVARVLGELAADHLDAAEELLWAATTDGVALSLRTRRPVDAVELAYDRPVQPGAARLQWRRDGATVAVDLTSTLAVQGNTVTVAAPLIGGLEREFQRRADGPGVRNNRRTTVPTWCAISLPGVAPARLVSVRANRAGSPPAAFQPVATLPPQELGLLFGLAPEPHATPQTWSGTVRIDGYHLVLDPVLIRPGTIVQLAPQACLVFERRVLAVGEPGAPIRFEPQRPGAAWGTVALCGSGADGSRFEHCEFQGGSGHREPLREYSAMFSLHELRNVLVRACTFRDSAATFDMVHVVYGRVQFDDCTFEQAAANLLACDCSECTVSGCRFRSGGGHGIDLLTTRAVLHDCSFERTGGCGIAAAAGSNMVAVRNRFRGNKTAMAASDGARAVAVNCEIHDCDLALDCRRTSPRQERGGVLELRKSVVVGNRSVATADKSSQLLLDDCQLDTPLRPKLADGSRNHAMANHCDPGSAVHAAAALAVPADLRLLPDVGTGVWRSLDPTQRGAGRRGE